MGRVLGWVGLLGTALRLLRGITPRAVTAAWLLVVLAIGCRPFPRATTVTGDPRMSAACALPTPQVLLQEGVASDSGRRVLQVFDVPDHAVWDSARDPADPAWSFVATELRRMTRTTAPLELSSGFPTANNRLVTRHAAEWLRPATCLEKALLVTQHHRVPVQRAPTEFVAVVLESPAAARLRIWYYSTDRNGVGSMTPLVEAISPDLAAGWRVRTNVHNHPFAADTARWHGIPARRAGDAQFYQNYAARAALPEARIANGFTTLRIPTACTRD